MNLYYFCSDFYPSNTGFSVAFHNFIKYAIHSGRFNKIYIYTTNKDAVIPDGLEFKNISLCFFSVRGELKLAKFFKSKTILDIYSKLKFHSLGSQLKKTVNRDDVFFYEEFYFGNLKKFLFKLFNENKHVIRVHGTMPEFVSFDKNNYFRKIFFSQALEEKTTIATTTTFYIDFLNENILKNKYDKIKKIDYLILPNAIFNSEKNNILNDGNRSSGTIKFLQLGRMDPGGYFQKGFDDTLKAFDYLEKSYLFKNKIELTIIGSGELSGVLVEKIKKLKKISIKHIEKIDNSRINEMILNSDAILIPSRCEGMSMFGVEAMHLNRVIVTTEDTGLNDICINNVTALKFKKFDYISYGEIIKNIDQNPSILREMERNVNLMNDKNRHKLTVGIDML